MLVVTVFGIELRFASVEEAEHFLNIIGQKNMPTTLKLSRERTNGYGPNGHWLSRLPAGIKAWSKRQKLIPIVEAALDDFRKVCI